MLEILAVVIAIALDQAVKLWAVRVLEQAGTIPIISGVFHLTYTENTGAAFSMLEGNALLLAAVPIVACVAIAYILLKRRVTHKLCRWSLLLILSGALGNLADRVLRGFVVDMFDFRLINFAIFNVADVYITVGAVLLFAYILFVHDKNKKGALK